MIILPVGHCPPIGVRRQTSPPRRTELAVVGPDGSLRKWREQIGGSTRTGPPELSEKGNKNVKFKILIYVFNAFFVLNFEISDFARKEY